MGFHSALRGVDLHSPSQETVENNTGSPIAAMKVVAQNGMGTAYPQIVTCTGGTTPAFGIVPATFATGTSTQIMTMGYMFNLNTNAWAANAVLYSDASGNLSAVVLGNPIAIVVKQDATVGVLYVLSSTGTTTGIRSLISGVSPITYSASTGIISLATGTANQVLGTNAAANASEYKSLLGTSNRLGVTQGVGTVTFNVDTGLLPSPISSNLNNILRCSGANAAVWSQDSIVQHVFAYGSSYFSTNSVIPWDNTIPQNTEGYQITTATITPNNASNQLVIIFTMNFSVNNGAAVVPVALFQDSGVNAIAANWANFNPVTGMGKAEMFFQLTAGTTSATTIKIRAGVSNSAHTLYVNGNPAGQMLGGVSNIVMQVIEITV